MPTPPAQNSVKWHKAAFTNPLMSPQDVADKTAAYRGILKFNLQEKLIDEVRVVITVLRTMGIRPVTLVSPPFGKETHIFGEDSPRKLKGEKRFEDAEIKVVHEYWGDWSRAKDLARCTVVVERADDVERAYRIVMDHFLKKKEKRTGFQFFEKKEIKPDSNACGYSGYTVVVQWPGQGKAEIQVNYVTMIYAKSMPEFVAAFGKEKIRQVQALYPEHIVKGGLGHELYEVARKPGALETQRGQDYAAACKAYYDYFRGKPDLKAGQDAAKLIADLKSKPPALAAVDTSVSRLDELLGPDAPDGRLRRVDLKKGDFKDLFGVERSLP
jgi:hypothetical protein